MWVVVIIFILGISGYVIWNLLQKVEIFEDRVEFLENWTNQSTEFIISLLDTIREIDSHDYFEEDDEVGVIFKQLKEAIESLSQFLE